MLLLLSDFALLLLLFPSAGLLFLSKKGSEVNQLHSVRHSPHCCDGRQQALASKRDLSLLCCSCEEKKTMSVVMGDFTYGGSTEKN
jgi:hypothetical protein